MREVSLLFLASEKDSLSPYLASDFLLLLELSLCFLFTGYGDKMIETCLGTYNWSCFYEDLVTRDLSCFRGFGGERIGCKMLLWLLKGWNEDQEFRWFYLERLVESWSAARVVAFESCRTDGGLGFAKVDVFPEALVFTDVFC